LETIEEDLEKGRRRGWKATTGKVIVYMVVGKEESV
jgi:hypothetical protein